MLHLKNKPLVRFTALFIVGCLIVTSTGGCSGGRALSVGGGPVSDEDDNIPPPQPGLQVRQQAGMVSLPSGSSLSPDELVVATSFGSDSVSEDGQFSVPVNQESAQAVFVNNQQDKPVLMSISANPGTPEIVSPRSTAVALLFLHPLIATTDLADARNLLNFLNRLPEVNAVEQVITDRLKRGLPLRPDDNQLTTSLAAALTAAVRAIQAGQLGQPSRVLPHRSSLPRRAVAPTREQSGVVVSAEDDRDPTNIKLRFQNFNLRFVDVWAVPTDSVNREIPTEMPRLVGLLESAEGLSIGSLLTDATLSPSDLSLNIGIPSDAERVRLETWGPGLKDLASVSLDSYLQRASRSSLCTLLFNFVGPSFDAFVGAKLLTRGPGRPTNLFRLVERLTAVEEIRGILQDLLQGNVWRGLVNFVSFMVNDREGRRFLQDVLSELGVSVSLAFLKRLSIILLFFDVFAGGFNVGAAIGSLIISRPREEFIVSAGTTASEFRLRVTLTWDKPNDIDLHTFAPNDEHSYFGNTAIAPGELDVDDRDGFGPENFDARVLVPGIYHVAVNYWSSGIDTGDELDTRPTRCIVRVATSQGSFDFSQTLTQSNQNDGYPVIEDTASWWRPCDIRVNSNGTVEILPPDRSASLRLQRILANRALRFKSGKAGRQSLLNQGARNPSNGERKRLRRDRNNPTSKGVMKQ